MKNLEDTKNYLEEVKFQILELKKDRIELYQYLMDLAEDLEDFPLKEKKKENLVKGCVSKVYIASNVRNERIYYYAESDSQIVKGYIAILVQAISGLKREDIIKTKKIIEDFIEKINILQSLTPNRGVAFENIYNLMLEKAE